MLRGASHGMGHAGKGDEIDTSKLEETPIDVPHMRIDAGLVLLALLMCMLAQFATAIRSKADAAALPCSALKPSALASCCACCTAASFAFVASNATAARSCSAVRSAR